MDFNGLENRYTIQLDQGALTFNTAIRAPCEGYAVVDYAAYVIFYVFKMIFTFHLFSPVHTDRSWTGFLLALSTEYDTSEATIPTGGTAGGNYVDITLKMVVMMDVDTVLVFFLIKNFKWIFFLPIFLDHMS